ncbi:MAG: RdgB/HAM1 family non-canonical purine NTP pyrophosphatase [Treponema sp.]|jgi:XTP/dITP diphosphohydrolase|nr:RdgB/HAM1 family non-canonical purine NTP pyrophosphatase [Treponema sp.]
MIIWFATGNVHKKAELAAILPEHTVKIPADAGLPFDPEETGAAFVDNALIKARALYRLVRETARGDGAPQAVIADDSGLCVDALGGRPGIYSSRYGGAGSGAAPGTGKKPGARERNALLLAELGNNPDRGARFVCAMVLLLDENRFRAVQETLEGTIVRSPGEAQGAGGFGYDPILYLPERGCTVAELPEEEKNRISHRGKAARIVAGMLETSPLLW